MAIRPKIILVCKCFVDNEICKVNDKLEGSCKDLFTNKLPRNSNDIISFLKEKIKNKKICKFAVFEKKNNEQ
jgi:hypothetical protein